MRQVIMRLDDEYTGNGLRLVPGSHGQNVPSTCTIVIIAGINDDTKKTLYFLFHPGGYLDQVDRVMTQVQDITEDIAHMPTAAFIFREKESDGEDYSSDIR